jgi:fatty acid desaturase
MIKKFKTINTIQEWPTWAVIAMVYSLWCIVLINFHSIPWAPLWLTLILGFHGSVQHELLHGHPTSKQTLNDLIAYPPLSLWYPYPIYKRTHLKHHENADLTVPGVDPESYFISQEVWAGMSRAARLVATINMTIAGRLLFAPFWHLLELKRQMFQSIRSGNPQRNTWLLHEFLCFVILFGALSFFDVNIFTYIACSYFAQSSTLLRSFYEHRIAEKPEHRSVVVRSFLPFRLLFLNNNFHALHHKNPGMSWFKLGRGYYSKPEYCDEQNGYFVERGYWQWFSKYTFKPVSNPVHPGFVKSD